MPNVRLGVMTLYTNRQHHIDEKPYFRKLLLEGTKMGMDVYLFTPEDVRSSGREVRALYLDRQKRWVRGIKPMPELIYDRCRYQPTGRFLQLRAFRRKYPNLVYLNQPLANKWTIARLFEPYAAIAAHLPRTKRYTSFAQIPAMLRSYSALFLKPINGTGGRGILRITQRKDGVYLLQGRDMARRIKQHTARHASALMRFIRTHVKGRSFILQQGIPITIKDGRVHDYRLLLQKNNNGAWQMTGGAGRIGPKRSITSNLHGGGKAVDMKKLLSRTQADPKHIQQVMYETAEAAVAILEEKYGKLCELAFDFAVDPGGHVWLLEVNPKPSREVFARIGDMTTYRIAIRRPLEYAMWLHHQGS